MLGHKSPITKDDIFSVQDITFNLNSVTAK